MAWVIIFILVLIVGLICFSLFTGSPRSKFRLYRVYKIAVHLDQRIDKALQGDTIDMFGNLNVVARNNRFFLYGWYHQSDVESIAKLIAVRKGFKNAYVEFGKGSTTFKFKLLER